MAIPNVNVTQAQLNNVPSPFMSYLTPDALMDYCAVRLRGLDTQVEESFTKQQRANSDSSVLSTLANSLSLPDDGKEIDLSCAGGVETAKASADAMMSAAQKLTDPTIKKALEDKANALYAKIDTALGEITKDSSWSTSVGANLNPKQSTPTSEALSNAQIDDVFKNYHSHDPDDSDKTINLTNFKAMTTDAVAGIQKDLNSNAELSMIGLQSLMSQRQQAIQVCTNLVQSLGDQCNKIAENVGK